MAVSSTPPAQVFDLRLNGPSAGRLDIVILAEGYTDVEQGKFLADAAQLLDRFFDAEPYREYAAFCNARAIFVASAQSGSDHPRSGIFRDTYFNSSYDTFGSDQIVTVPPNDLDPDYAHGRGRIDALVTAVAPESELVALLVNDLEFGGSGGPVLISSLSAFSAELLIHESGHTFGLLADEYEDPYPLPPQEMPNVTAITDRVRIPWTAWIAPDTPIPTPATPEYGQVVGLFEGAMYQSSGWYRPRFNCRMRTLGAPFCEICTEQIIRRLYAFSAASENPLPSPPTIDVVKQDSVRFQVTPARPRSHAIELQWLVDGVVPPGATGSEFDFDVRFVTNGWHTVACQAADRTPWVRTDPDRRLQTTYTWQVYVERPSLELGIPVAGAGGTWRLMVSGTAARGFTLQTSADLLRWEGVSTNVLTDGRCEVVVTPGPNVPAGFYRAVAN